VKKFLLLDGRAKDGTPEGEEAAIVMDIVDSEQEARRMGQTTWEGHDGIWFEYDDNGKELTNGSARWDLPPCE